MAVKAAQYLTLPLQAAAVFSSQKNFSSNRVIGSRRLNARGLHRERLKLAHALSWRRRKAIARHLDAAEREAFDRDGFVVRENALPQELFERLVEEVASVPRPSWEMRQGHAITRIMPIRFGVPGSAVSEAAAHVNSRAVRPLVAYVAGRDGFYNTMLQTIANHPDPTRPDPQNTLHADTFHPTAKFWLFLQDVGLDDGPFSYVPGSHRLTEERLRWEHEQAVLCTGSDNRHHAAGSFRTSPEEMAAFGYGEVKPLATKANTLVVADTYGFHRRTPTNKPTVRTELYGMLRRNPFMPWNGLDVADVPGLNTKMIWWYLGTRDRMATRGKPYKFRNAGLQLAGAPAAALPERRHAA